MITLTLLVSIWVAGDEYRFRVYQRYFGYDTACARSAALLERQIFDSVEAIGARAAIDWRCEKGELRQS